MAQYIDKSVLISEIEDRLNKLWYLLPDASKVEKDNVTRSEAYTLGKYTALESIKDYINTFEVKKGEYCRKIFKRLFKKKDTLRDKCVAAYGEEFGELYDIINKGDAIGCFLKTDAFLEMVEDVKQGKTKNLKGK